MVQTAGRVTSCRFHRTVPAALHGADGGSCQFQSAELAALCNAGVCLALILLLNAVYLPIHLKLGLVVGMTNQMSDGKEEDILNC